MYKGDTLYKCSEERIKVLFDVLSACADRKAVSKVFSEKMKTLGAKIMIDDLGNTYASLNGSDADSKKTVISCPDSEDITSLASALEVCETLVNSENELKHTLTVLLWNDEPASDRPQLVPAMGILCGDYLPEEIRRDYTGIQPEKASGNGKIHRLNTSGYGPLFEVHANHAGIDCIGIADIVPAVKSRMRGELRYNEKLMKLTEDAIAGCGMKYETLHYAPKRDTWIAAHMMPSAVILTNADDAQKCADAATVLLNTVLMADKI